ncbi:MAG: hypothetical protein IJ424_05965 [Oscillospiraceae bacterium]|nr:hypothetical protein [Oscillospiraceae bacterium]
MKKSTGALWGIVLVVLGVIFGLNALDITDIDIFFDGWWTLFIIVPCVIGLINEKEKTGNLIGLLIGVVLLLACQDILRFDLVGKLIFPVILVVIGISLVIKYLFGGKIKSEIKQINEKNSGAKEEFYSTFTGQDLKFNGQEFKGTSLSAVFGSIKCDLTGAIINEDVVINASAVFGGIDIIVPSEYNVKIQSNSIFGGVSNKRGGNEVAGAPTVYVNGSGIFGGVDIR